MKWFIFLLTSLFLLLFSPLAFADTSWIIENFNANIAVQKSGTVQVNETISVDFRNNPEHGIYRDIPYLYESSGKQLYTQVDITKVLRNNLPTPYTLSQTNGYEEIKIGNLNQTVTGRNIYTIVYTITGVLRGVTGYDELYWNITGNNWPVRIQKAEATVTFPMEGITRIVCYEGALGSQSFCQSNMSSQIATFETAVPLNSMQGLTVVVDYKKGLIPLIVAHPPKSYWEKLLEWPSVLVFLAIFFLGLGVTLFRWYRYGRDYWFAGVLFGTKDQKGKVKQIGAHETISVEFTPPENLRPAEIGVLMDERADTLDITATIIDLATRGYLTITEVPKKWLFGNVDYLLTKTKPQSFSQKANLLAYEQLLLNKLFYRRSNIKVSSLKKIFYKDLKEVKRALYEEVVSKQFFATDPEKVRRKYYFIASIVIIGGIGWTVYGLVHQFVFFGDSGIGLFLDGIIVVLLSKFMPRRTAYGRELYRRSRGYYLFIDRSERYRQRYFEKQNMFNKVLPYVIIFGLTGKFAKAMKKMEIKPEQTSWYVGTQPFAAGIFVINMHNFSTAMSSAIASIPSNSGGFSGGSSGGGFGGGGGGSW